MISVVVVIFSGVGAAVAQLRVLDAAREIAILAARGDPRARETGQRVAPDGAAVTVTGGVGAGDLLQVEVTVAVSLWPWPVVGRAAAVREPGAAARRRPRARGDPGPGSGHRRSGHSWSAHSWSGHSWSGHTGEEDRAGERGGVSITVALVMAGLLTVTALVWELGGVVISQHRGRTAADLAALAAVTAELRGEDGCAAAERLARENAAALAHCSTGLEASGGAGDLAGEGAGEEGVRGTVSASLVRVRVAVEIARSSVYQGGQRVEVVAVAEGSVAGQVPTDGG